MTEAGAKTTYICSQAGARSRCPVQLRMLSKNDGQVTVSISDDSHEHPASDVNRGIDFNVREQIDSLFDNGVQQPQAILRRLADNSGQWTVRAFWMSKRLLENTAHVDHLATDATNKLNWQGNYWRIGLNSRIGSSQLAIHFIYLFQLFRLSCLDRWYH